VEYNDLGEVNMEAQYDLFEMKAEGYPQWVGAAASLEHARIRLHDLAQSSMGSNYFARDFYSGSVVAVAHLTPNTPSSGIVAAAA
jgi:hypothetical protein